MALTEQEIVEAVAIYLLKNKKERGKWKIENVSVRDWKKFEKTLRKEKIAKRKIPINKGRGKDIVACRIGKNYTGRKITIEAKGERAFYGFYTAIGQFVCGEQEDQKSYWFGFAFPSSWEERVHNILKGNPIIESLVEKYKKKETYRAFYFFFVDDKKNVDKKTWNTTLNKL